MSSKLKQPSILEGISRLVDIPGKLSDNNTAIYRMHELSRKIRKRRKARSYTVKDSSEVIGARAINSASKMVNRDMSVVAVRMRPVIADRIREKAEVKNVDPS